MNKYRIFTLVKQIPQGKIVSYGQIARAINLSPRVVGFILSGMNSDEMNEFPWHRVVDRNGYISSSKLGPKGLVQQKMLEAEGIKIHEFQIIKPEKYWFYF